MTNSIFANLGVPEPDDGLYIAGPTNLNTQGAIAARIQQVGEVRSTNYQTFPIYGEAFILSILQDLYLNDPIFTYVPGDELQSRVFFTTSYPRNQGTVDKRPTIVVAFQGANAQNEVLRDTFQGATLSEPIDEKRGVMDQSNFKVSILHSNRTLCLFIAQQCRAEITMNTQLMRELFGLQQVLPPGIQGPGEVKDYSDLFICTLDVRCSYLPKWTQREKPDYIARILLNVETTAREIVQDAVIEMDAPGTP